MGLFENTLSGIIDKANARQEQEQGREKDYIGPDGFLVCGYCHKPRQMELDVPLIGKRIVPVMCACEIERREREEAARKAMEEQARIEQMRRVGITSADYRAMTMAADDGSAPNMTALASRYVAKRADMFRENIGLLFHGGVGGGKTFWAAAIANAMIDNGMSAMVTTIPQLITAMGQDFEAEKEHILGQVKQVRFLVLDDVGFERLTTYAAEKMFEIVDARYRARRPLIVTTNLSLEQLSNPEQMEYKRVFDRIIEMCQPVHVAADGRRKAVAQEKSIKARELLGL